MCLLSPPQGFVTGAYRSIVYTLISSGSAFDWPVKTVYEVYKPANCSDNGGASTLINSVSRERMTSAAATDADTPTYLRIEVGHFHPTYSITAPMAMPSILCRGSVPPEGLRRAMLILHARRHQMSLEAGGYLRRCFRRFPVTLFKTLENNNPDPPARTWLGSRRLSVLYHGRQCRCFNSLIAQHFSETKIETKHLVPRQT